MSQTRAQLLKGFSNTSSPDDAIIVNSSGNVAIGATAASTRLDVEGNNVPVEINSANSNGNKVQLSDAGTVRGYFGASSTASFLVSGDGGSEQFRVQAAGGISFNGDTAAANALDDYEEGSWTPTANQSISLTVYEANYVKIGASVTYTTYFAVGTNTGTSSLNISGFPFNADGSNNYHCCAVNSDANLGHQLVAQYNRGTGSGQVQLVKDDSNNKATGANMSGKFVIFTLTVTLH